MIPAAIDLDLQSVRRQFPALGLRIDGRPVVYLDNPAGTQVPQRVIDRTTSYWQTMNANQGGVFATSERSDALMLEVRAAAAAFVNADSPEEIVFGPNMTTLTFAVSRAIARELRAGDEILVTRLEHDGNVSPWLALQEQGIIVRFADIKTPECTLDLDDLRRQLTARTRLVAVTHASNVVGTIPDLPAVASAAHAVGAWMWVDAVHYGPHGSIDVQALDCDFLVCSSYKFYGPHLGILYGRRELLERLRPYKVRPASDELPSRWETGTQNHESLAGLELIRGIQIFGITAPDQLHRRAPTVSLIWPPHRPQALARWLAGQQIFTWHGDHYATELIARLGLRDRGGTLRIGPAHYNTASEVDLVLEVLAGFKG